MICWRRSYSNIFEIFSDIHEYNWKQCLRQEVFLALEEWHAVV